MKHGDSLVVIEGEYTGYCGQFVGLTTDGLIEVEFGGRWRARFHPHHLELAPLTLWNLLAVPTEWWRSLDRIPARED